MRVAKAAKEASPVVGYTYRYRGEGGACDRPVRTDTGLCRHDGAGTVAFLRSRRGIGVLLIIWDGL